MTRNQRSLCLRVIVLTGLVSIIAHSPTRGAEPSLREALALPELIQEALTRNPEIQASRKHWEASANRVEQARALDDPILQVQLWNFPDTFKLTQTQNTILGLSQKLPFPGKLALKGEVASRSADIGEQALRAMERTVIARLKQAYYDLFLAHKAIQIHHEQITLLQQFAEIATTKFKAGKGGQADVLKAQVELSVLHQHFPVLKQRLETAEATLNILLDRDPRSPLGVPADLGHTPLTKTLDDLHQLAVGARPELKASDLAVQRNERAHALAQRQFYPDFNVAFQRFQNYQAPDGFGAVFSMNVPFAFWSKSKYDAGVQEAAATVAAARADLHTVDNLTRFQIKDLVAKVQAAEQVAVLYSTTVLPQAGQSLEAARAGYRTGKAGFLDLIETERALRGFQLEYYKALVERQHRLAELEQVIGTDLERHS